MKLKLGIVLPLVIIAGTGTWLIINRIKKKKLMKQLTDDLATGANSGDSQQSIGTLTKPGGALDPNYFNTVPAVGKKVFSQDALAKGVKIIHGYIHGITGSNESALINLFSKLRAKTEVSQLADDYQKTYGISLADDLKTIDYTPFSIKMGTPDLPKVMAAINSLPDK